MALTPKQEAFCQAIVVEGTQAAAYRIAYPKSVKWKDSTVHSKASIMMADGNIVARVNVLRERAMKKHDTTVETLITELEEARQMGISTEQAASMTGATMGKAKILGLITDKTQVTLISPADELIRLKQLAKHAAS